MTHEHGIDKNCPARMIEKSSLWNMYMKRIEKMHLDTVISFQFGEAVF